MSSNAELTRTSRAYRTGYAHHCLLYVRDRHRAALARLVRVRRGWRTSLLSAVTSMYRGTTQIEQFRHLFASLPEGSGCKRDGSDGRRMPSPVCVSVSKPNRTSVNLRQRMKSVAPIVGWSLWTIIGNGAFNRTASLQDGDTVTICNEWGNTRAHLWADHDARSVRPALMAAYYRGAPEPPAIAEAHAAGTLAVSVHLRNGDTAKLRGPGHKLRYTRAVDLVPMMSVVAALPSR